MKYFNLLVSLALLCTVSSCFTNRLVKSQDGHQIVDEEYKITLINVAQNGIMNAGGPGFYSTVRDEESNEAGKFYKATVTIENTTANYIVVDLKKLLLCDDEKNCLTPSEFHMKSIVDGYVSDTLELKPNKEKGRELYYIGPKRFIPKYLLNQASGRFIEFQYKD